MRAPGAIIRARRQANGLTQAQLALRAHTTQAAISRLERDELSPTFETFAGLLAAMGETFAIEVRRQAGDFDRGQLRDLRALTAAERLELSIDWNRLAGELALAGRGAQRETPLDGRRILAALADQEVEYVLIGGLAVQAHGNTRTTQHADLVPAPAPANLIRLAAALESLGARPAGQGDRTPNKPLVLPSAEIAVFETDAGAVDVHFAPPGAQSFGALRRRGMVLDLGALEVPVASRDDLIAMKRAAGRPIDRGDVIALTEPL